MYTIQCYDRRLLFQEKRTCVRLCLLEALADRLPVDDVPDGREVLGLAVLVLQVVGVLPGVNAEKGDEGARDGVLVGAGDEGQGARGRVLGEPGPAGALDAGESGVELLDKGLGGAKVLLDLGLQSR